MTWLLTLSIIVGVILLIWISRAKGYKAPVFALFGVYLFAMLFLLIPLLDYEGGLNFRFSPKPGDEFLEKYTRLEDFYNKHESEIVTTELLDFDFINLHDLPLVYYQNNGKMYNIKITSQEEGIEDSEIELRKTVINPDYKLLKDLKLYKDVYTITIPKGYSIMDSQDSRLE